MKKNPSQKLKLGFVQYAIQTLEPEKNITLLLKHLQRLLKRRLDLVMLPEIFLGGPTQKSDMSRYAALYNNFLGDLCSIAKIKRTSFYGSIIEKHQNQFYNSAVFTHAGKSQIVYRKNHLFRFDNEHKLFASGNSSQIFQTPWGKMAPQICYDIRFPELLRKLTFQGATVALVCAQWPDARREHWLTLLRARAIENQMFIIACNRTGSKNALTYRGHSCIISPWGDFQFLMKGNCATGTCSIDLGEVANVRERYPFLNDAIQTRNSF